MKQVSFLDYPELIGSARHGVRITPGQLASRISSAPEVSFDDLGFYEFLGVAVPGGILGFRKHLKVDGEYSYVSCVLVDGGSPKELIAAACEIDQSEVLDFDEPW